MDARIARTLALINRRMRDRLTITDLAEKAGLSPSRFAHVFRREVGVSPGRYLHEVRMQRARALLESSFKTVTEVMEQVGCRDASHFTRDFRRYHGCSPTECRGSIWGRQPVRAVRARARA
jgi:AraC family transcriptional regulator of arabinose operon